MVGEAGKTIEEAAKELEEAKLVQEAEHKRRHRARATRHARAVAESKKFYWERK